MIQPAADTIGKYRLFLVLLSIEEVVDESESADERHCVPIPSTRKDCLAPSPAAI